MGGGASAQSNELGKANRLLSPSGGAGTGASSLSISEIGLDKTLDGIFDDLAE